MEKKPPEPDSTDWELIRRQFPALRRQSYFRTPAAGPLHADTWRAIRSHVDGLHEHGLADTALDARIVEAYQHSVSALLGTRPENIGWAPSTSHSMNVLALMFKQFGAMGRVVTSADEFPASTAAWKHHGFDVCEVRSRARRIDIDDLLAQVDSRTVAVVLSAVQAASGFRSDLVRLGHELERRHVPFIVNATQCLGAYPVSVDQCRISALSASTHKWLGAGFSGAVFYLNEELREWFRWPLAGWRAYSDNNASATLLGYPPLQALTAISRAVDVARSIGVERIAGRIHELSGLFAERLRGLGAHLYSPRDDAPDYLHSHNSGILTLEAGDPRSLVETLQREGVLSSERDGMLRFGVHYFNSPGDIERAMVALSRMSAAMRAAAGKAA